MAHACTPDFIGSETKEPSKCHVKEDTVIIKVCVIICSLCSLCYDLGCTQPKCHFDKEQHTFLILAEISNAPA